MRAANKYFHPDLLMLISYSDKNIPLGYFDALSFCSVWYNPKLEELLVLGWLLDYWNVKGQSYLHSDEKGCFPGISAALTVVELYLVCLVREQLAAQLAGLHQINWTCSQVFFSKDDSLIVSVRLRRLDIYHIKANRA